MEPGNSNRFGGGEVKGVAVQGDGGRTEKLHFSADFDGLQNILRRSQTFPTNQLAAAMFADGRHLSGRQ